MHRLGKKALLQSKGKHLRLPKLDRRFLAATFHQSAFGSIHESGGIYLMKIAKAGLEVEVPVANRRVDAMVFGQIDGQGVKLAVEINVTNSKDERYRSDMDAARIDVVEIDLTVEEVLRKAGERSLSVESLIRSLVLSGTNHKRWLNVPRIDERRDCPGCGSLKKPQYQYCYVCAM